MRKNIKNYTSGWTLNKSVSETQNLLASKGAEKIMVDYQGGEPVSISFTIRTSMGVIPFVFPARIKKVMIKMFGTQSLNKRDSEQAKRTAWKNIYDLIDAQMAFIETEQTSLEQLMLGFSPVYKIFKSGKLQLKAGDK